MGGVYNVHYRNEKCTTKILIKEDNLKCHRRNLVNNTGVGWGWGNRPWVLVIQIYEGGGGRLV